MIEFLNENTGAITGLATVALLLVTAFYAWTTHRLFKEAETTRLSGGEPRVVAYLRVGDVHTNIAQMHITNLSGAGAVAVTAEMERVTDWPKDFYFEDSKILRDLSYMRPHEVLKFDLGVGPDLFRDDEAARFRIRIRYQSLDGRSFSFDEELRVESIEGHSHFRIYGLDDVARRLDEISKSLKSVIWSRKLRVDTYSSDDRAAEREAQERWRLERSGEQPEEGKHFISFFGERGARIAQQVLKVFRRQRPSD